VVPYAPEIPEGMAGVLEPASHSRHGLSLTAYASSAPGHSDPFSTSVTLRACSPLGNFCRARAHTVSDYVESNQGLFLGAGWYPRKFGIRLISTGRPQSHSSDALRAPGPTRIHLRAPHGPHAGNSPIHHRI